MPGGIARADHVACMSASMSILGRLRDWLLGRPDPSPHIDLPPSNHRAAVHDDHQCAPVTLSLPRLPRAVAGPVVKRRRTDATYMVDLAAWSCTCPYAAARSPAMRSSMSGGVQAPEPAGAQSRRGAFCLRSSCRCAAPARRLEQATTLFPCARDPVLRVVRLAEPGLPRHHATQFMGVGGHASKEGLGYDARPPGAAVLRDLVGAMSQRGLLTAQIEPLLAPEHPEADEGDD